MDYQGRNTVRVINNLNKQAIVGRWCENVRELTEFSGTTVSLFNDCFYRDGRIMAKILNIQRKYCVCINLKDVMDSFCSYLVLVTCIISSVVHREERKSNPIVRLNGSALKEKVFFLNETLELFSNLKM
jgi:hypothetical protein